MRGIVCAVLGAGLLAVGSSACAQTQCSAQGSELVFFGAGGRNQGGPAQRGPGGPPPQATVPDPSLPPQGIYAACLDTHNGQLTSLGMQSRVDRPSWVFVDPKKAVLYTTGGVTPNQRDPGSVFSFKINRKTGALQPLGSALSGGSDPTHLAWAPRSATVFVANHGDGSVGVLKTDPDGGVRNLSDKAQQEGSGPTARQKSSAAHGLAVDPTGRFVLCADFGADKIYIYRFDSGKAKLTPASPAFVTTPPGSGPRHITFSPDGKHVIVNTELNGQMRVYRWNESSATLEAGQVVDPFPADYQPARSAAELAFSRDGKFLYLSLRGVEDKLVVYRWSAAEGKLAEIQRVASSGGTPWSFGLDPTGKWLLVVNSGSGNVSSFSADAATGKLTMVGEAYKLPGVLTVGFLPR